MTPPRGPFSAALGVQRAVLEPRRPAARGLHRAPSPFTARPAIVAHRGFGRGETDEGIRENTLAAFQEGLRCGVEWLEVDVRRSADDALFVLHHPTLDDGSFVIDLTSAQVRAAGVLALDDLLCAIPSDVGIVFDVKTSLEDALRPPELTTAGLLLPVLAAEHGRRPMVVTSFDPAGLLLVGERLPGVARGLLSWLSFPLRKAIPAAAQLGLEVVSVHWKSFAANNTDPAPQHRDVSYSVDIAHRAGLQVVAWCPTQERGAELLAAGVDALIVDDIPGALAMVADLTQVSRV
jgi:glycerophosphoryl diester phosphodiesterase